MCTAISFKSKSHYFGRNLDLEYSYNESITITPRNYPIKFCCEKTVNHHYAIIGTAYIRDDFPLYYDATNEKGLSVAGLRFTDATYQTRNNSSKYNISPFELILWVLSGCKDVFQARKLLENTNLVSMDFSSELPVAPLHWIIADKNSSFVIEPTAQGVKIYDNPVNVLTNSPAFPCHLNNLKKYIDLPLFKSGKKISDKLIPEPYSFSIGAIGLPGDFSSTSRFVRAAYTLNNSICEKDELSSVSQFFHILSSVSQKRGCVRLNDGKYHITVYSSCCNTDKGIYYYTAYDNSQITAVDMHHEELDSVSLISYKMLKKGKFNYQN